MLCVSCFICITIYCLYFKDIYIYANYIVFELKDGNEVEEWDRHEAFTDDPSNQERNKERSYEPEIEVC